MRTYFLTGGTGFVGRALVRELLRRDDTAQIICLTRRIRSGMLDHEKLSYLIGDVTSATFPSNPVTDVIHAAAEANDLLMPDKAQYYYDVVEGAQRVFDWSARAQPERMLFVSSGAVLKGDSIYCRAKRMSERLLPTWGKVARIYSLVGPEMPLDGQYALGKFIHQAIYAGRVSWYESGSIRSYLHVDDCARWLCSVLDSGGQYYLAYDIGSSVPITIRALAHLVADTAGVPCEEIKRTDFHLTAGVYIPTLAAVEKLGCVETTGLRESIKEVLDKHSLFAVK